MATQYLLPCPECDHTSPITTSQAGGIVNCSNCGNEIAVPSMSGIRALPPAEAQVSKSKSGAKSWSHSQGVYFSGGLLALLIGGVLAGVTISIGLRLDTQVEGMDEVEASLNHVEDLDIGQTWQLWSEVMDGQSLGEWQESQVELNRRWRSALFILAAPCLVIAVAGVGCMIYSMRKPKPKTRPGRKKPRT